MADLAASDVTVTLNPQDVDFMTHNKVTIPASLRGAGKTYRAGKAFPWPTWRFRSEQRD